MTYKQTASSGFSSAARSPRIVESPRVIFEGQSTIMKVCKRCEMQMPHIIGAQACILCAMDEDERPAAERKNVHPG